MFGFDEETALAKFLETKEVDLAVGRKVLEMDAKSVPTLEDCVQEFGTEHPYFVFFELDEFLVLKTEDTELRKCLNLF